MDARDGSHRGPFLSAAAAAASSYASLYEPTLSEDTAAASSTADSQTVTDSQAAAGTTLVSSIPLSSLDGSITLSSAATITAEGLSSYATSATASSTDFFSAPLTVDSSQSSTLLTTASSSSQTESPTALSTSLPTSLPTQSTGAIQTPLPDSVHPHPHRHGVSPGAITVAAILPLLVILVLLAFALTLVRRRRRREGVAFRPMAEVKDKIFFHHKRKPGGSSDLGASAVAHNSMLRSAANPTYFTGLDTESQHSGTPRHSSEEAPPPPYRPRSDAAAATAIPRPQPARLDTQSRVPAVHVTDYSPDLELSPISPLHSSPFEDPQLFTGYLARPTAAAANNDEPRDVSGSPSPARPLASRNVSNRSFTSTLYSSNASVNEAEAARMSVGGAHVIGAPQQQQQLKSPFADPEED